MARTVGAVTRNRQEPEHANRCWRAMRYLKHFALDELVLHARADYKTVYRFVRRLELAGYLRVVQQNRSGQPGSTLQYRLVRDSGPKTPLLRKNGREVFDPNTKQTHQAQSLERDICLRQRAWEQMRQGLPFTARSLAETGIAEKSAQKYLTGLHKAGVLQRLGRDSAGCFEYALAIDCGPVAPKVRRDGSVSRHGEGQAQ